MRKRHASQYANFGSLRYNAQKLGIMELHRFFRYAIEKMCKEKKSLNHFNIIITNNPPLKRQ